MFTTQQGIQFRFPTVRSKLQNLFPFDPKSDIEYQLQLAYLRLQSGFFKQFYPNMSKPIRIIENFNKDYFEQIMKCFYGGTFRCPRRAFFEVWKILQFLKIQNFKKLIINDIKNNFQKYNFFQLMTFGFMQNVQQVFNSCLVVLDSQNFIQLKKNKEQFLNCPLQVFKFLINMHNRRPKPKRALNYIEINNLICQYSQKNQYSDQFYKQLKFQLIERTELTAQQYRIIFIEGAKSQSTRQIPQIRFSQTDFKNIENNPYLIQSAQILSHDRKPIKPQEKVHWQQKLSLLKSSFQKNQDESKSLKSSVANLTNLVRKKQQSSKIKQKSISRVDNLLRKLESQVRQAGDKMKSLSQRLVKLETLSKKNMGKSAKELPPQQQQQDQFVQSHIIPGFVLSDMLSEAQNPKKQIKPASNHQPKNMVANFSKKKKSVYQSGKIQQQSSIDYSYRNSLLFDKEPTSVPKRYLTNLSKILDTDPFVKKKQLNLIFKRTIKGGNIGDPSTIKNRNALLVLFQTQTKKYAGGYISVQIPSYTKQQNICDYQSFLFSLTHNVKLPIIQGNQEHAISLSKHYLISFGNDLMISTDCLNDESYCQWPSLYEVPKYSKCTSAKDLVGGSQFKIQQIEIYQVKSEEIEMVL